MHNHMNMHWFLNGEYDVIDEHNALGWISWVCWRRCLHAFI